MIDALIRNGRAAIEQGHVRHYGGFLLAGLCALATDTAVLSAFTRLGGLSPFLARPFGIACAMVVSWLINRRLTFQSRERPSLKEFSKFAGVSLTSQTVNYAVFATLLLVLPGFMPELALVLASCVSMFVSYAGFRLGVFRSSGVPGNGRRD